MKQHLQGVHHVSVSVPDIETARRFYIDLLGAEEIMAVEWHPGNAWIDAIVGIEGSAAKTFMARLKNIHVEVFEYTSPVSPPQDPRRPVSRNGYTHIGFRWTTFRPSMSGWLPPGWSSTRRPIFR